MTQHNFALCTLIVLGLPPAFAGLTQPTTLDPTYEPSRFARNLAQCSSRLFSSASKPRPSGA